MDIDSLQDLRDVTIIAFTIAGTVLFLFAIIASILAIITFAVALRALQGLRNSLQPTLEGLRETVDSVRGTTTFLSETAVSPFIRVFSIYAGGRRFLGAISRLFRRGRR